MPIDFTPAIEMLESHARVLRAIAGQFSARLPLVSKRYANEASDLELAARILRLPEVQAHGKA